MNIFLHFEIKTKKKSHSLQIIAESAKKVVVVVLNGIVTKYKNKNKNILKV
jgi:hypothetical protein